MHEPGQRRVRPEVMRGEQVPLIERHGHRVGEPAPWIGSPADQAVGLPAGLGTAPAIPAPSSDRGREEALARPAVTEGSVGEDLELDPWHGRSDGLDL